MIKDDLYTIKLVQFIISGQLYPEEELKEIKGTEGKYYISSFGRVLSVCGQPIMLKPFYRNGYKSVRICGKDYYIHRLVVEYYISKCIIDKRYLLEVHHKDKNKLNNNINNLQILTKKQHHRIHRKEEVSTNES